MSDTTIEMVLEPEDEYPHEPDASPNYNESMYLNLDQLGNQTAMRCRARTESGDESEVTGEVISLIPLRNRRTSPDGGQLTTRITEAMTRYHCNGLTGVGMSEYLDQVVDGWPTGPDLPTREVLS